jgi:protein-S-isoprenylcysteine O-methyltransferase Ste14
MAPMTETDSMARTIVAGIVKTQIILAALIFGLAWSLSYWQGWLFWFVFLACMIVPSVYFLRHDPDLVRRRLHVGPVAESRPQQKVIQSVTGTLVCATVIVSVLDHRYGWSPVPWSMAILGNVLIVLGFAVFFVVFRENTFAASTVEISEGQRVIDTGPYAWVRHPMYTGAIPMFFGVSLALDSYWGLVPAAMLAGAVVWRLLDEEIVLVEGLPGYTDYQNRVRARLVPGIW